MPGFTSPGWHRVCSIVNVKIAGLTQRNKNEMKTSHLKIMSTCGLAALCLIAVGPATVVGQPVYAPIDLSTNPPAPVPPAATPAAADASASVTVTTNSVAVESTTVAPAAVPATPAADVAAAPATTDRKS